MRRGIDFACGVWSRQQEKAWRMRRREPHSRKWRNMSVCGKECGEKVAHFDSQDSPQIFEITAPKPYESGSKGLHRLLKEHLHPVLAMEGLEGSAYLLF